MICLLRGREKGGGVREQKDAWERERRYSVVVAHHGNTHVLYGAWQVTEFFYIIF